MTICRWCKNRITSDCEFVEMHITKGNDVVRIDLVHPGCFGEICDRLERLGDLDKVTVSVTENKVS